MKCLSFSILAIASANFVYSTVITPLGSHYNEEHPYVPNVWNYDYSQPFYDCPICTVAEQCGPNCWGNIVKPDYVCSKDSQSPVNIVRAQIDSSLVFPTLNAIDGGCSSFKQFADDHSFEVKPESCKNLQLTYSDKVYTFAQVHMHAKSEHTVKNKQFDAEAHMVHIAADGSLLVVGVFLSVSDKVKSNPFFEGFWKNAKIGSQGQGYKPDAIYSYEYKVEGLNPLFNPYEQLLPSSQSYYTYSGSLTTPKCSEPVKWFVMEEVVLIGEVDLQNLIKAVQYQENTVTLKQYNFADYRPVQPLNGRVIKKYVDPRTSTPTDRPTAAPFDDSKKICQYGGYCKKSSDCVAGNKCYVQSVYYSQCLPDVSSYKTKNCLSNWGTSCKSNSDCCDPGAICNSSPYKQCQQPIASAGLCYNPTKFSK